MPTPTVIETASKMAKIGMRRKSPRFESECRTDSFSRYITLAEARQQAVFATNAGRVIAEHCDARIAKIKDQLAAIKLLLEEETPNKRKLLARIKAAIKL